MRWVLKIFLIKNDNVFFNSIDFIFCRKGKEETDSGGSDSDGDEDFDIADECFDQGSYFERYLIFSRLFFIITNNNWCLITANDDAEAAEDDDGEFII